MAMSLSAAQPAIPTSTTSFHPRDRRWIIVHPSFPLGFRHFLDPHQQRERTIWINVPWCQLPIPLVFQQRALHAWDSSTQDSTGHVLWRASQKLSEYIIQYSCSISKPLTVLELGCGACALPSIIASLCGHKVIATDLKEILPPAKVNIDYNLKSLINLRINAAPWTIQCTCEDRNSSPRNECKTCNSVKFPNINVCELLWGQPHTLKDNGKENTQVYHKLFFYYFFIFCLEINTVIYESEFNINLKKHTQLICYVNYIYVYIPHAQLI